MAEKTATQKPDPLAWWREARFGMFIHWGIYAVPAGTWKGQQIPSIGEWIMCRARIPIPEYEQIAKQFNPVKFNAPEWVQVAKDAGMKYLVITSKHHDGFAMYHSPCSPYNIVDATPYGRDVMKDLAEACREAGIRLCFYYSQAQDWHDPDAAGNNWDFPDEEKKDFAAYLQRKCVPQVKEILTQYGPIGLIWFDTPRAITKPQSEMLRDLVHELQPNCLVSGRVGHDVGDYGSMGDNQIPAGRVTGEWETPATLNDTWGFKSYDHNWKSTQTLLYLLVDLASKGVNYLLNVGPTAEGEIPAPSVERLREIGQWMNLNGEAIYGTAANPFPYEFEWGRFTQKPGRLFLHFYQWPADTFRLFGLRSRVKAASLLAGGAPVAFEQTRDAALDQHVLELTLPAQAPDPNVSVVVLEIEGAADVEDLPLQQPDGKIALPAYLAELRSAAAERPLRVGRAGSIENWLSTENALTWTFKVSRPGKFQVQVLTGHARSQPWKGGHQVRVEVAGQTLRAALQAGDAVQGPRVQYHPEMASPAGTVRIERPGTYTLSLDAEALNPEVSGGFAVAAVQLAPA